MQRKLCVVGIITVIMVCFATGVLSDDVQFHGFVQSQINIENDSYGARIPRYGLRITQKIDDEFTWLSEFYVHPTISSAAGRLYMESAWIQWNLADRLPWDFRVRFGKGRNDTYGQAPYYSRRRTSDYPLYTETFTHFRVVGFQTFSTFGPVELAIGLLNPNLINQPKRDVPGFAQGTQNFVEISDRDNDQNPIKRVALSGRLGYKNDLLNVGGSAYLSETGPEDKNVHNRFGVDAEVKLDNGLLLQGQASVGQTALTIGQVLDEIDHNGGEILVGWEDTQKGVYARYGMLTFDDKLQALNQIMLSAIYKIRPTIHLRLEGNINGEEEDAAKGWSKVDNDRIFFETLFAF